MTAPNYSDFTAYGFSATEDEFNASLATAQAIVDRIVGPNEVSGDLKTEAYKKAVCAVVCKVTSYGDDAMPSVRLGAFSIGASTEAGSGRELAAEAATCFLAPAGLAFAGV